MVDSMKPLDPMLKIAQQILRDAALGLDLQFKVVAGSEPYRLQIRFDGADEVREFRFDHDGVLSGSSTKIASIPEPQSKLRVIK
jgi:hypothetical protein